MENIRHAPHYEVRGSKDGQYYWVLVGGNGEVMATSEMYSEKSHAKQGAIDAGAVAEKIRILI